MAITYGFYNSMNGDRKYDAVQLSSIFDGVIRDGVFQSIGGYLATKPGTGMRVIVAPGKAWFDHTWTVNDADLPLDISPSDLTLSRYDAVILETDATKAVRENSIKVIKGTPASSPQKPTLTNEGDVHQHPLAYILVPGGSTEIQVQNIDIMVGKAECPFVTSILESVSIEALLAKWEGEFKAWSDKKENDFQTWFDDLQSQMGGDVATNLQNQINKINQTTATRETKSLYGVPSDGTPDDVFQAINSIGDIKVSTRTDLGDSWLLCNGEFFDENRYPDLPKVAPKKANVWNNKYTFSDRVDFVRYVNGYIFVKLRNNSLYYAKNPSGPWASVPHDNVLNLKDVGFFNGEYFLVNGGSAIFVSSSLDGPWEDVSGVAQLSKSYASSVVAGGKLFVLTVNYGETTIDIFTSLHQNKVTSANMRALNVLVALDGAVIAYNRSGTSGSFICTNPKADTPTFYQNPVIFEGYGIVKSAGYTFYFSADSTKLYRCLDIKQADINTDTVAYKGSITTKMVYASGNLIMLGYPSSNQSLIIDSETFETFGNATTNPRLSSSLITQTDDTLIGISGDLIVWTDSLLRSCTPVISIENAYAYIRGK